MVPVAARLLLRQHARLLLRGRLEFGEADRALGVGSSSTSRTGGSEVVQLCWPSHVCEDALPPSIDIVLPVGSVG